MGELLGTSISRKLNLVLKIVVAMVVAFALATIVAPATEANAAAKKQTVTTTIKMGNKGCDCPELTFVKVVKKGQKATKTVVQAVSKWTIDGKVEKKPFDRFYAKGWKFSKHNINVVMKTKLAPGTYKVYVDNGTTKKKVGTVKVAKKAVAKTVRYANDLVLKQTVTTTIKMGNKGCDCPELTFVKVVKKGQKATKTVVQAVSKWTIDGKVEKKPFDRFYAKGWKFSKHNINVVMKTKLAPGTYKVYVDNGTTKKKVGTVKVAKKAVAKTVKYA